MGIDLFGWTLIIRSGAWIPMAVFPVLFLVLSSYLMGSGWMFAASLIFGTAHIWILKISLPGK